MKSYAGYYDCTKAINIKFKKLKYALFLTSGVDEDIYLENQFNKFKQCIESKDDMSIYSARVEGGGDICW